MPIWEESLMLVKKQNKQTKTRRLIKSVAFNDQFVHCRLNMSVYLVNLIVSFFVFFLRTAKKRRSKYNLDQNAGFTCHDFRWVRIESNVTPPSVA